MECGVTRAAIRRVSKSFTERNFCSLVDEQIEGTTEEKQGVW